MNTQLVEKDGLRIAIEGCGHGTLHSIYASVTKACDINGWKGVDLLIIGGDFQAVRNAHDLNCMSVPVKYREIGDFWEYYNGTRQAPYLTLFIGGNHEASNHLFELYYGGWAAPNIYYMGAANVLRLGPLRIAGLSGIWKGFDYKKPHHERLPYNQDDVKSIYHVREWDVRKLLQIRTQIDVGISHDWPRGIEWKGDWKKLFRKKNHFEQDARTGQLGSVAAKYMLDRLRPAYWFSAHLHIKYPAVVEHEDKSDEPATAAAPVDVPPTQDNSNQPAQKNSDEIDLDLDMDDSTAQKLEVRAASEAPVANTDEVDLGFDENGLESATTVKTTDNSAKAYSSDVPEDIRAQLPASFSKPVERPQPATLPPPPGITNTTTKFLALDKCLPNRDFLQIIDGVKPVSEQSKSQYQRPLRLEYDKEWLAITRVFASSLQVGDRSATIPHDQGEAHYRPLIEAEEAWIEENLVKHGRMVVPNDFVMTAPEYEPDLGIRVEGQPREYTNPSTKTFCELLQIPNPFDISEEERTARMEAGPKGGEPRMGGGDGRHGGGRGRGGFHRGGGFGGGRGRGGRGGGGRGRGRGRGGR